MIDYVAIADQYIEDIISGEILASKLTIAACQRQREDRERLEGNGYYFDHDAACDICDFVEKMPHIKGEWARQGLPLTLEPWQVFILTTVFGWMLEETGRRRFRMAYIEVARKNAKAEWIGNLIPTPDGFKQMGEIVVDDYVFSPNGKPIRVIAATDVMYGKRCMEVCFSTGEKIVVAADHLWKVESRNKGVFSLWTEKEEQAIINNYEMVGAVGCFELLGQAKTVAAIQKKANNLGIKNKTRTRTKGQHKTFKSGYKKDLFSTEELSKTVNGAGKRGDRNHSVLIAQPVIYQEASLPIAPYLFGAWLGDGTSKAATITVAYSDFQLVEELKRTGAIIEERKSSNENSGLYHIAFPGVKKGCRKNSLPTILKKINVFGNKHIPRTYLHGSVKQRMELLRGLMDTDGTISKAGQASFCNINKQLIDNVFVLVNSLGFKATITAGDAILNGKNCGKKYLVSFYPTKDKSVFKLSRKAIRQKTKVNSRTKKRTIVAINAVESVPVRCIQVDSPDGLYLTSESYITTHNSTLTSAVGLYMLTKDQEQGAECYSAATTRDQAKIVWNDAKAMANKEPEFKEAFGVHVGAHSISVMETSSVYQALSSEGSTLDGLNTHFGGIDELHAHKTRKIFDVLETSTGSRSQSLLWAITTAGSNRAGICYEQRSYVVKIMTKKAVDESYFGLIYTLDKEDDWQDQAVWGKSNPNLGVSLYIPDLARLVAKAMQLPSAVNNLLTKRFNVWVNADESWLDMKAWDGCADNDLDINDFLGEPCVMGFDLASKIDINAKVLIFERDEKFYMFSTFYLPEYAIEIGRNSQYQGWEREGRLIGTPGRIIDLDLIEDDIRRDNENFILENVGYDPHQATQLVGHLMDDGIEMIEVRPTVLNFSEPMKQLEAIILDNRLVHAGCPIMAWMMSNVVCHHDAKDNIYPRKEREENKIDGPVAAIMALHLILHIDNETSIYENEGVLTLDT